MLRIATLTSGSYGGEGDIEWLLEEAGWQKLWRRVTSLGGMLVGGSGLNRDKAEDFKRDFQVQSSRTC